MNNEIKNILEKHGWDMSIISNVHVAELKTAIKEICELQKRYCIITNGKTYEHENIRYISELDILTAKNIAE